LSDATCDAAIRYVRLRDVAERDLLLPEHQVVVYSPALLKQKTGASKGKTTLAALCKHPLLYEGTTQDWLSLLRDNRIGNAHYDFSRSYSHSGLLVQAAVAGHGVALVPYSIAYADIQKGSLQVFPCRLPAQQFGCRVLYDGSKAEMRKVKLFAAWMRDEIAEMEHAFAAALE
jgi:LysR family glycine cleavage system transcriptional activator